MFGTIARVTVKPGREQELIAVGQQWTRERAAESDQVAEYLFKLKDRDGQYMLVGIFASEAAYYANAAAPETDRCYRALRELLATDPEWNDGEVVLEFMQQGI